MNIINSVINMDDIKRIGLLETDGGGFQDDSLGHSCASCLFTIRSGLEVFPT